MTKLERPTWGQLRACGVETYDEYLRSSHWQGTRARYRNAEDRPHNCIACGDPNYQLHHTTYERLGEESLDDLQPLCGKCHAALHVLERRGLATLSDMAGMPNAKRAAINRLIEAERQAQLEDEERARRDAELRDEAAWIDAQIQQLKKALLRRAVERGQARGFTPAGALRDAQRQIERTMQPLKAARVNWLEGTRKQIGATKNGASENGGYRRAA